MIRHPAFSYEPWRLCEEYLELDTLAQTESVFTLANGHLGLRANLEEGEPAGMPGTYLNSVFERRPLPYAEAGFGYPEAGQSLINVTDGKLLRLLVDDEPFDVRYGELLSHRRILDLKTGLLHREAEWRSPAGQAMRLRTVRLVSFTQRSIAAIHYEVEAIEDQARIVVQSELVANEPLPDVGNDPRVAAALNAPLEAMDHGCRDLTAVLVHRTAASGLGVAVSTTHTVNGPDNTEISSTVDPDIARVSVTTVLEPGQKLQMVKFLAYGWSATRSRQALRDQVSAALTAAAHTGWDGLVEEQRGYLDAFWEGADVELDGDPEIQSSVRFGLFHVLQAGARAERRAISAKGLTGTGYDGHAFWDTESFVLPVLTYTMPSTAADALRWRHSTLPAARERARTLGLRGATFPWRTITGEECSSYWPAGTAAFHVNADIADAVLRYLDATEDDAFETNFGLDLLVETARLWMSLGHHDRAGMFRIDGVTGPDEYSAVHDNNVYTNLLAQQNLRAAAECVERHPDQAAALGLRDEEVGNWRAAAAAMFIPYDEHLKVNPQSEAFTEHEVWNFADTKPDQYPLLLSFPYFDLYRKQVVKQADLVLAMHLRTDAFDDELKARNFAYYERLTVRDSSLSAATQAVLAAECGHLDLAYDYLAEAALIDLDDTEHNTRDGLHIAALAGGWTALVAGFGGLRTWDGTLHFAPRLPPGLTRLAFRVLYRGRRVHVGATATEATYELGDGAPIELTHHGERFTLKDPVRRPIPAP
ncbi:MAG TPA: glycosyl hydrolase family 65 protein, partial [Acidimicrobiia bacterium]|nr:glycosyl hydrolase family 65 protein [Acidimicrobiia bacterium]